MTPAEISNQEYLKRLKTFLEATEKLSEEWLENPNADFLGIEGYPNCLPSFDDFVIKVKKWYLTQSTIINQLSLFIQEETKV